MRKHFFAIYFIATALMTVHNSYAGTQEVMSLEEANRVRQSSVLPEGRTDTQEVSFSSPKEMFNYMKNRLKGAIVTKYDPASASNGSTATSVDEDPLPEDMEAQKSTFQKIYEDAIKRIENEDRSSAAAPAPFPSEIKQSAPAAPVDAIDILLPPLNERVRVPAFEHIPYLFSQIEVLPDGLIKVEETVIVIANGIKLKTPLVLPIPDRAFSRDGKVRNTDASLIGVTINDMPVEYKIDRRGGSTLLMPKKNFVLENGVYRYVFTYVIDRQIWSYPDFDELYWNVTGGAWNLVVARAGATIVLPRGTSPIAQSLAIGYPGRLRIDNGTITRDAPNSVGFVAQEPLFLAESMHIGVEIPKGVIAAPTLSNRIAWAIADYGDTIFALIGLLIVLGAYTASWKYIQKNPKKVSFSLKKTPMMLRYLAKGTYDKVSFGAFLLDLFKKNIIDIQLSDGNILLVKKTDNLKVLNKNEQNAVKELFGKKDAVLQTKGNMLKLKRAYRHIGQDLKSKFNFFALRLNSGYLLFSIGMLLMTEWFIAMLSPDTMQVFASLLSTTVAFGFYLVFFSIRWKNKFINILCKAFALLFMILSFVIFCAKVSMWSALLLCATMAVILVFSRKYTQRSGLMQGHITDARGYADYLTQNRENIMLGKDFINQQANILALEVDKLYPKDNSNIKDYYKLDIVKNIIDEMS
ncbi:MAG: DUF2207 domain-containing protein [Alphaproteobacteria bacterium]|nr:DUF2207 domain-containing protein [Alphaproteobacteria bacterium]